MQKRKKEQSYSNNILKKKYDIYIIKKYINAYIIYILYIQYNKNIVKNCEIYNK